MPVRMLNFLKERPPAKWGKGTEILSTQEYQDTMIALGAGLKPQEFISVNFPVEHEIYRTNKYPLNALSHVLKKKCAELHLPYDIYIRNEVLYIVGRGVQQS